MFQTFIVHKGASGWTHSVVKPNLDYASEDDTIINTWTAVVVQIDDGKLENAQKATEREISYFQKGQYCLDDEFGNQDNLVECGHRLYIMKAQDGRWIFRFMRRKGDHWRMHIPHMISNYVVDVQEEPDVKVDSISPSYHFETSTYMTEKIPDGPLSGSKRERDTPGNEPPSKKAKTVSLDYSFNAMNDFVTQSDIRSVMEYQNKAYLPKSSPSSLPPPLKPKCPSRPKLNGQTQHMSTHLIDLDKLRQEVMADVNQVAKEYIASDLLEYPSTPTDQTTFIKSRYIHTCMEDQRRLDEETTKKVDSIKTQMVLFQRYLASSDTITEQKRKECKRRVVELIHESESVMTRYQKTCNEYKTTLEWKIQCLDECVSPSSYLVSDSYY